MSCERFSGKDASDFIRDCIYVNDGLCSVPSELRALELIKRSVSICKEGGIQLVSETDKVTQTRALFNCLRLWP